LVTCSYWTVFVWCGPRLRVRIFDQRRPAAALTTTPTPIDDGDGMAAVEAVAYRTFSVSQK
jgi:hypothetical protein